MPTLFSKFNGKGGLKPPLSGSRYGRGISSTDLTSGTEDAPQLEDIHSLRQLSNVDLHKAAAEESAAWRLSNSQQIQGTSLTEFGVVPSKAPSQQKKSGTHIRSETEPRRQPSKAIKATSSLSSARRPTIPQDNLLVTPHPPPSYGYTTVGWDTQLDTARAVEVILACGEQIRSRGLDSPLIFSSMALDLSSHNVASLIQSFLNSPSLFFSSDVKFANAHDLAAVIKWSMARLGRVFAVPIPSSEQSRKGEPKAEEVLVHQRGFLDWEVYTGWTALEKSNGFPATAFSSFLDNLPSSTLALLVALFSLLSSTTSYSVKNGMTPSRLSRLFGPLLFGLPEDETFDRTYEAFVKAGNATEHLLLAYIRDCGTIESLPTRLADHIRGYPAMLSVDLSKPSRSVRGVPMTHVNRSVRLYSLDILQTGCEMELADQSPEWKACCSHSDAVGKDPQLADRFRKLINLRGGKKQGRSMSSPKETAGIENYSSLVDKQWGDFIHEGFAAPDQSKLNFDLRESERKARSERPGSVHWSQFEQSGFVFADDGLASVLNFDDGLKEDMQRWPAERAELMEKLRLTTKKIPDFPYDTTPSIVSSPSLDMNSKGQWETKPVSRFDEVFAEVYADILLGNGWSNRDELTYRNANFAVVQYKSRPLPSTVGSQSAGASNQTRGYTGEPDDRVDAAWFVVEEIVPSQYRSDLEASGKLKNRSRASLRKLNIFKRRKEEGNGANSSKFFPIDRSSFDDVFRPGAGGTTKKLQLAKDLTSFSPSPRLERMSSTGTARQSQMGAEGEEIGASGGGSKLMMTLNSMTTMRSKSMKVNKRRKEDDEPPPPPPPKNGMTVSRSFGSEDFDTRSLHDPELEEFKTGDARKRNLLKSSRRQSKDDSWLDVMIRANGFRMAGQDASRSIVVPSKAAAVNEEDQRTPTREATPTLPVQPSSLVSPSEPEPTEELKELQGLSPMPPVKKKAIRTLQAEAITPTIPKDSLQMAGWTREDAKVPVRNASLPLENVAEPFQSPSIESPPPTPPKLSSPVVSPKSQKAREEEVDAVIDPEDSPAKLAYLKPLPPRSSSPTEIDEREKARGARIQAAKDRARELRANLNPVVINELENRKEKDVKPLPSTLLTPVKPPIRETDQTPSPQSSVRKNLSPKDDPFAKDRFSGRVASVASKFGGGQGAGAFVPKPLTPQSTGNSSMVTSPTSASGFGDKTFPISTDSFHTPGKINYPYKLPAEPSTFDPKPSTFDPNEQIRLATATSVDSNNHIALGTDNDSIYPDDAASNFSRETEPEEVMASKSIRSGGSTSAAISSGPYDIGMSPDINRLEEEDKARGVPPIFRIPYQPGMPLSNLEEESESVLSGSNNA